jgi:hypothetical protein
MHYALGTVYQPHVNGMVILAAVIAVVAFWRQIIKAVIVLFVAAVIVGLTESVFMLLHHG